MVEGKNRRDDNGAAPKSSRAKPQPRPMGDGMRIGSAFARIGVSAAMAVLCASCAAPGEDLPPLPTPVSNEIPVQRLLPGDEVELKFFYTPELNEIQTIRADGRITAHLVGEVLAAGKTVPEFHEELLERYGPHLNEPEISILVRSTAGRLAFVGGWVEAPGAVELNRPTTVLEAILAAGGVDRVVASNSNVIVVRMRDGRRLGYSVDLTPAIEGDEEPPIFYLEPGDVVWVPQTRVAHVAQWIDQNVNGLIPQLGLLFTRRLGDTTVGFDTGQRGQAR